MRQIEVINQETIIDVTAETSSVEILVRDYDSELVERFALEAQEAAIEAEESADIATAQASIATAQATIATTQAGIATTQAGIATTQSQIATTKANEASASAASALASEQAADVDRIAAQAAASTATTQAGIATTQAGIATTKAGEASDSAAAALASETDAETAASTATTQAGIATTQAGIATTQAGIATTQAGNALTSANNAAASAAAAAQVGTSTPLTGFSTGANSTILATDTILQGFNKTQGQINARVSGTIGTGQVAFGTDANTIGGDSGFTWDNTLKSLSIQSIGTGLALEISRVSGAILRLTSSGNGIGANVILGELQFFGNDASAPGAGIKSRIYSVTKATLGDDAELVFTTSSGIINDIERWRMTDTGILQSNGAQTIQTSTGALTLATGGGNGNIFITPNGTGQVIIGNNDINTQYALFGATIGRRLVFENFINNSRNNAGHRINASDNSGAISLATVGTDRIFIQSNGNVGINTTTDAGFRLDVNGSTRFNGLSTIQGTTASDSGQLGSELLTTGTGDASWTGTSFATGYTHVAGSTTTLTSTLAGVANTFYQITYTVTGRTAGSFTIAFGGVTSGSIASTGAIGPQATTTGTLVITPTTDFNGTIVLSIRTISASSASVTFNSSGGTSTNTIRISNLDSNTFVGFNTGQRNTTGVANTFIGSAAGQANTTGIDNSFFGRTSGISNTTGTSNSFYGRSSGQSNISGSDNSFFGRNSGLFNTTGGFNSFFGASSGGANTTGGSNSFFGLSSGGANTTGSLNAFFGTSAGGGNTTGAANSFFGHNSGVSISAGSNNVIIGQNAARFAGSGTTAMTSLFNSIYLGFQTRGLNATGSTNEVVIGYDVVGLGSNTTVLGNTSTTHGRWYGSLLLGTTTNAASSILTMESTTQGVLFPRMTTTQKNAIASPAEGLVVYDTTLNKLSVRGALTWETVTSL